MSNKSSTFLRGVKLRRKNNLYTRSSSQQTVGYFGKVRDKWDNPKTTTLFNTILALKNLKEAKAFFRDLLTVKELEEFGNRWLAAQMLNQSVSYSIIQKRTGLSTTTIARISKWLQNGKGGYRLMLKRIFKNHHRNSLPVGKGLC